MARPSGKKTRCDGEWTEAKFNSFIKNQLRSATIKWAPIQKVRKAAHVRRGFYLCSSCNDEIPSTVVDEVSRRRVNNVIVDHISPIIDPAVGFVSWDEVINRMFCDSDNLAVVCRECHKTKTNEERAVAAARRAKEKSIEQPD